jgi:heat shock protein HslJ
MRRPKRLAAVLSAVLLAAGSAQAGKGAGELFGHGYVSTKVLKGGDPHPLFEGAKVRVDFDRRDGPDVVRWRADCNYFGADVRVTEERLVIGQIEGTDMACAGRQLRRDRWLLRFFAADPRWRIPRTGILRLIAGDRVIRLRRGE